MLAAFLVAVVVMSLVMLTVSACQVKVDQSEQMDDGNIRGRR